MGNYNRQIMSWILGNPKSLSLCVVTEDEHSILNKASEYVNSTDFEFEFFINGRLKTGCIQAFKSSNLEKSEKEEFHQILLHIFCREKKRPKFVMKPSKKERESGIMEDQRLTTTICKSELQQLDSLSLCKEPLSSLGSLCNQWLVGLVVEWKTSIGESGVRDPSLTHLFFSGNHSLHLEMVMSPKSNTCVFIFYHFDQCQSFGRWKMRQYTNNMFFHLLINTKKKDDKMKWWEDACGTWIPLSFFRLERLGKGDWVGKKKETKKQSDKLQCANLFFSLFFLSVPRRINTFGTWSSLTLTFN